jgi:hypothetical protein
MTREQSSTVPTPRSATRAAGSVLVRSFRDHGLHDTPGHNRAWRNTIRSTAMRPKVLRKLPCVMCDSRLGCAVMCVTAIHRRLADNQSGKRQVVVAMRERDGRTLAHVFPAEADALATIRLRIAKGTTVHADESLAWNTLHASFAMQRINHQDGYSIDGACTNGAASYFSRLRRGELGHHHHIAGPYLVRYAQEAAWREGQRRISNGEQVYGIAGLAMRCGPSVDFCGYWQRAPVA